MEITKRPQYNKAMKIKTIRFMAAFQASYLNPFQSKVSVSSISSYNFEES